MQRQWLSPEEAAGYLGVNRSTIYKWAREGRLEIRKLSARTSRIDRKVLDRLLEDADPVHPRREYPHGTR